MSICTVRRVVKVGRTSLTVQIDIYIEQMYSEEREKAITGLFKMVAVGEDKKAIPVLD